MAMTEQLFVFLLLVFLVGALTWGVKPALRPAVLTGLGLVLSGIAAVVAVFAA
jgi:hypothetical protein